jgi:hypothetical protein
MIFRVFNYTYQSQIFVILIAVTLLWLPAFTGAVPVQDTVDTSPFSLLYDSMQGGWIVSVAALALLVIQGAIIAAITGNYRILGLTNLTPFFFYILFMSFSSKMLTLNTALFSNFFVLLVIRQLIDNYGKKEPLLQWFNTSLLIGVATLIHPANIFLLILLWTTYFIYRIYQLREWIISLLGILFVFLLFALYLFFTDNFNAGMAQFFSYYAALPSALPQSIPINYWAFGGVFLFLVLITMPRMIFKLDENIIRTRKRLNVIIFHAIFLLATVVADPAAWEFFLFQLFIPLSFTVSRLVTNIRKEKVKDGIVIALLLAIIFERFFS